LPIVLAADTCVRRRTQVNEHGHGTAPALSATVAPHRVVSESKQHQQQQCRCRNVKDQLARQNNRETKCWKSIQLINWNRTKQTRVWNKGEQLSLSSEEISEKQHSMDWLLHEHGLAMASNRFWRSSVQLSERICVFSPTQASLEVCFIKQTTLATTTNILLN
jgi:hypothetical protein